MGITSEAVGETGLVDESYGEDVASGAKRKM